MDESRPTSERIALARLAERAIAADPGVSPTDGARRWVTRDGERAIPGVVAIAAVGGRVDLTLHLVAYLPPRPLGKQMDDLREKIESSARRAGLEKSLGHVNVSIHDLVEPEAPERARA